MFRSPSSYVIAGLALLLLTIVFSTFVDASTATPSIPPTVAPPSGITARCRAKFELFKKEHKRHYSSRQEEQHRLHVFCENLAIIDAHESSRVLSSSSTFTMEMNHFGDMTWTEFSATYLTRRPPTHTPAANIMDVSVFTTPNPVSVDWRAAGIVNPIKNQGQCGSCWAFSTITALESANAQATGKLVSLSEQELVDCSGNGNTGCDGGDPQAAYEFAIQEKMGEELESVYPYTGVTGTSCLVNKTDELVFPTSFNATAPGNETALETAIANVGVASICFDVVNDGVYSSKKCSSVYANLNHCMGIVGYSNDLAGGELKGWLVRNSWGTDWGVTGYVWVQKDANNMCGVATECSFPSVFK